MADQNQRGQWNKFLPYPLASPWQLTIVPTLGACVCSFCVIDRNELWRWYLTGRSLTSSPPSSVLHCCNYHIFFVGGDRIPFFLFREEKCNISSRSQFKMLQASYLLPTTRVNVWSWGPQVVIWKTPGSWSMSTWEVVGLFFYERPGGRRGGFCHFRKSFLGWSALLEGHRGKGVFQTHKRVSEEILRVEAAWQNWGRKEGRYVQVWLEMSFTKNTSILVCTFLRRVKRKMEEVTFSGFVAF